MVEPFKTDSIFLIIGAIPLACVRMLMMMEGPIDGQVIVLDAEHLPATHRQPGDILIIWGFRV